MDNLIFWADLLAIALAIYGTILLVGWYILMRKLYGMRITEFAGLIRWAVKYTLFRFNHVAIINWVLITVLYGLLVYVQHFWLLAVGLFLPVVAAWLYVVGKETECNVV